MVIFRVFPPAALGLLWPLGGCGPGAEGVDTGPEGERAPVTGLELGELHDLGAGIHAYTVPCDPDWCVLYGLGDQYYVAGYDADWTPTGFEATLTPDGIMEGDHAVAWEGEHVYHYPTLQSSGVVRGHDVETFELEGKSEEFEVAGGESLSDPCLATEADRVLAGTELRGDSDLWGSSNIAPNDEVDRGLRLRVFDSADLAQVEEVDLLAEIDGAEVPHQYWGKGTSILPVEDELHLVVHTSVGNTEAFDSGESAGARQVFVLRFDESYGFLGSHGPLTDEQNDNYWSTGAACADGRLLVSHTFRTPEDGPVVGPPEPDGGNIRLALYDETFALLDERILTDVTPEDIERHEGAHRSHLLLDGDRLIVTWDQEGRIYVQEVTLRR